MLAYLLKNSQLPLRTGANVGAGNPSGIPFKKGNPKFAKAIDDAMTQLEADGTFSKISTSGSASTDEAGEIRRAVSGVARAAS